MKKKYRGFFLNLCCITERMDSPLFKMHKAFQSADGVPKYISQGNVIVANLTQCCECMNITRKNTETCLVAYLHAYFWILNCESSYFGETIEICCY